MRLYLVRHGEAVAQEEDGERPLTEQGRQEVRAVAQLLARLGESRPAAIVHSGKTRARQTAEIIADSLGQADALREEEDLTPNANPKRWVKRLDDGGEALMLVGHLPHLGRLLATLLEQDPESELVHFEKAAVVCLAGEDGSWGIEWMLTPALAHAMAGAPSDGAPPSSSAGDTGASEAGTSGSAASGSAASGSAASGSAASGSAAPGSPASGDTPTEPPW
jgi:phosphohistidine phosphatase